MMMNKLQGFTVWLDGFLDASGDILTTDQTKTIKQKLNGLFEHVAEAPSVKQNASLEELGDQHGFKVIPGFPGDISYLGFGKDPETGESYRC